MAEYLHSILIVGILVAVAVLLSPGSGKGKIGKYISFIGSLTMALVILSPLFSVIGSYSFENGSMDEEISNNEAKAGEYYANSAGMVLCEIYKIPMSSVNAKVVCNDRGEIEEMVLYLKEEVIFDKKEAGKTLSNIFDMNIRVTSDG